MSTWRFVERLAERLPDARLGEAHEGSPAYFVGRHPFARFRQDDEGRQILQTWSGDLGLGAALADRRETFPVVQVFTYRVSTWAYLAAVDDQEVTELVLDSYLIRGPVGRRGMDLSAFLR